MNGLKLVLLVPTVGNFMTIYQILKIVIGQTIHFTERNTHESCYINAL